MKFSPILVDYKDFILKFTKQSIFLGKGRLFSTNGKTTFNVLKELVNLKKEKIDYDEKNHRLKWLNIIISNAKNNITSIYKGVTKRNLPLFLNEQEWRFNHRNISKNIMDKVNKYIVQSVPMP